MPDTRMSFDPSVEIADTKVTSRVGLYEDGQPGELFITMSKEGRPSGGLMDTVGHAHVDCAPVRRALEKFGEEIRLSTGSNQAASPKSGTFGMRPALPTTFSAGWPANSLKGYKEATSPSRGRRSTLKEIGEMEKKALNRPVSDLARTGEKELIDVITSHSANDGEPKCWATAAVRRSCPGSTREHVHGHHLFAFAVATK